jgi:hypothetical protein
MPKVSKNNAVNHADHGLVEEWNGEIDGYTINFLSVAVDHDMTPMLKGLPGDHCTCPHWGYVTAGRLTFIIDGHEEVHEAGDAFYVPGGHLMRVEAGTEYVQFSPSDELRPVTETIMRNLSQLQRA